MTLRSTSTTVPTRWLQTAAVGAAALVVFAGCSKTADTTATGTSGAPATSAAAAPSSAASSAYGASPGSTAGGATASGAGTIAVTKAPMGDIVVDANGMTLYVFDKDTGTTSSCSGACATAWPPATVTGKPTAGTGVDASKLATTTRSDGSTQVTYNGHPLYRFAMDKSAGQTTGQGVGGTWWVVNPSGEKVSAT
jgi:predicted lipoprotein with Yx(FWY)xxD motif